MHVQYVGFNVGVSSRVYSFNVVEGQTTRAFELEIQLSAFRTSPLKFQDGPGLCSERLRRALGLETQVDPTPPYMTLGTDDIELYVKEHYPLKGQSGRRKARQTQQ